MTLEENLKQHISKTYRGFGDKKALVTRDKRSFTGEELATEIDNETEVGMKIIKGIISLSIDLMKRNKEKYPGSVD